MDRRASLSQPGWRTRQIFRETLEVAMKMRSVIIHIISEYFKHASDRCFIDRSWYCSIYIYSFTIDADYTHIYILIFIIIYIIIYDICIWLSANVVSVSHRIIDKPNHPSGQCLLSWEWLKDPQEHWKGCQSVLQPGTWTRPGELWLGRKILRYFVQVER